MGLVSALGWVTIALAAVAYAHLKLAKWGFNAQASDIENAREDAGQYANQVMGAFRLWLFAVLTLEFGWVVGDFVAGIGRAILSLVSMLL